jgi:hypothetical protein
MNETWVATLTGSLLTGSFALFGVAVTLWFQDKRNILEHNRWYVDHFIGEKLQSFRKLYVALVDCHFTMNFYGNDPPQTLIEFKEKVSPKEQVYLEAMVMASLYLNEDENKVFSQALGAFRQASMAIWLHLPDGQIPVNKMSYSDETKSLNWGRFTETYDRALKLLQQKLNPESLKNIEKTDFAN